MTQKKFVARFYRITELDKSKTLLGLLQGLVGGSAVSTSRHEIRSLRSLNNGGIFIGIFALLRDEAPTIRDKTGGERDIALQDGEAVLEKLHFIYYAKDRVLVWQQNVKCAHVGKFENYFAEICNFPVIQADEFLTKDSIADLTGRKIKKLEVTIANPKVMHTQDKSDFRNKILQDLLSYEPSQISINLSSGNRKAGLSSKVWGLIEQLSGASSVKTLALSVEGRREMIDLLGDVIKEEMTVKMIGHYPSADDMFSELMSAYDRQKHVIRSMLK